MNKIGLVICSTASRTESLKKIEYGIVNLKIILDEKEHTTQTLTLEALFKFFNEEKKLGKTSQPSPGEIGNEFVNQLQKFDKLIVIAPAPSLSGTYQNIKNVVDQMEKQELIKIIDSQSIAVAESVLIDEAISLIENNESFEKIVEILEEKVSKLKTYVFPGAIKYLHASGRVSATKAIIGSVFGIKIGVESKNGLADIVHRGRGLKSVFEYIEKLAEENKDRADVVYYTSFNEPKEVFDKVMMILEKNGYNVVITDNADVVVATHFGPESFAFTFNIK